jgi:hypothetical protein
MEFVEILLAVIVVDQIFFEGKLMDAVIKRIRGAK